MSSLATQTFPEAGKNLFGPSFEKKVKKRSEPVKILSTAAPKKSRKILILRFLNSHPSRTVRICGELPKIPTKSYTVNRGSGFPYKFSKSRHQPTSEQSKEYQKRVLCGEPGPDRKDLFCSLEKVDWLVW